MRGIFPEAVSGDKGSLHALFVENAPGRNGNCEDRRLRNLGQAQLLFRAFEAQLRQRVAECVVSFFERLTSHGKMLGQVFAHTDCLRALAREQETNSTSAAPCSQVDTLVRPICPVQRAASERTA